MKLDFPGDFQKILKYKI